MSTAGAYVSAYIDGRWQLEHRFIVELALGHPLRASAPVHHVDGDPGNNDNTNLVACDSIEYHALLHRRQRALDACGNPSCLGCETCYSVELDRIRRRMDRVGNQPRRQWTGVRRPEWMTDKLAVRWMTTGEAARALGISKARVVTLALREVLRHSVVKPYHPVILRTSVDAYIAARKNVAVNNTVGVA